jgi:hypothetical protein
MIPPRQIPAPLPVVGLVRNQIEKTGVDQTDQCKQSDPEKGLSNLPIAILLLHMRELMGQVGKVKIREDFFTDLSTIKRKRNWKFEIRNLITI